MAMTLYFYDLETSGFNAREARIMQFAGQRTDLTMKPIGEPDNFLIKMTNDILPEPDAILITGITPQQTIADGYTEAEFLKIFHERIVVPQTIFVGYNTVRFDDEFMRFLQYRNFYDAYEWQWQDGRSRWDMLDVVRMTRALRPEGIKWPFDAAGRPSNRLEYLTNVNRITHKNAHDALADVYATIAIARLIRNKQPKLFNYLLEMRDKKRVEQLVLQDKPFVYTSGKYNSDFEKTTVAGLLSKHPTSPGALVFDLRYDPSAFIDLDPPVLAEAMRRRIDDEGPRLPVKTLKYNRCPAVAPLSVLDSESHRRLSLDDVEYIKNYKTLIEARVVLSDKVSKAIELLDQKHQVKLLEDEIEVDARLYEGFFSDNDRTKMSIIRATSPDELSQLDLKFADGRLETLLPLYKARNFSWTLTGEERMTWEQYKERRLMSGGASSRMTRFFVRLGELIDRPNLTPKEQYLLEELRLYAESIFPAEI